MKMASAVAHDHTRERRVLPAACRLSVSYKLRPWVFACIRAISKSLCSVCWLHGAAPCFLRVCLTVRNSSVCPPALPYGQNVRVYVRTELRPASPGG